VLSVLAFVFALKYDQDPFSPLAIIFFLVIMLYVCRPLWVLHANSWGPTRAFDDRAVTTAVLRSMTTALWIVLVSMLAAFIGYALVRLRTGNQPDERSSEAGEIRVGAYAWIVTGGFAVLALGAYASLVLQAGGLSSYLDQVAVRSQFFSGRSFVTLANLPLKAAVFVLIGVALRRNEKSPYIRAGLAGLFGVVLLTDFLTGGRAAILTGSLLPAILLVHYLRRRLTGRGVLVVVTIAMLVFIATRAAIRDYAFQGDSGRSRAALIQESFTHAPQTIFGGHEAIAFDSLSVLTSSSARAQERLWGTTYEPIATYPIPRFLWPGKPLGGGNTWFTSKYFPEYYGSDHIETSISFLGETYANFGAAGSVIGLTLLFALVAAAYSRLTRFESPHFIVQYSIAIGYLVTLLRGDAFHSFTGWAVIFVLVELIWRFFVIAPAPVSHRSSQQSPQRIAMPAA
jgi:hypothetical protein